jgi:hypothetical protein
MSIARPEDRATLGSDPSAEAGNGKLRTMATAFLIGTVLLIDFA